MSSNSQTTGLFPGYKNVGNFGPDDEYESGSEEIEYVTLDLGSVDPSLLLNSSGYRLIVSLRYIMEAKPGLDSETPFLQLGGTVFQGRHQDLLGSEMLFENAGDTGNRSKKETVHVANTSRRIRFDQVELRPKGEEASEEVSPPPPQAVKAPAARGRGRGRAKGRRNTQVNDRTENEQPPDSSMNIHDSEATGTSLAGARDSQGRGVSKGWSQEVAHTKGAQEDENIDQHED